MVDMSEFMQQEVVVHKFDTLNADGEPTFRDYIGIRAKIPPLE